MGSVKQKSNNEEPMHLCCRPFWWPRGCVGAMLLILPNAACPGVHWKPLDAAIGQLLAPYFPGKQGQQQTNQQWKNAPTFLAILMAMALRRYDTVCIAQWRRSRALVEATGRCHLASIAADRSHRTYQRLLFLSFFIINSLKKVAGWC